MLTDLEKEELEKIKNSMFSIFKIIDYVENRGLECYRSNKKDPNSWPDGKDLDPNYFTDKNFYVKIFPDLSFKLFLSTERKRIEIDILKVTHEEAITISNQYKNEY